jgi:hypothetical protein
LERRRRLWMVPYTFGECSGSYPVEAAKQEVAGMRHDPY